MPPESNTGTSTFRDVSHSLLNGYNPFTHRRTGTLGLGGTVTLLPEKNYTMPESVSFTYALKSQWKQKRSHFSRLLNYYHSEIIAEFRFLEPRKETKIAFKNRIVREIGVKIIAFDWGEETTFGSSYGEDRKNEGSGNRESTVVILKHRLLLANDLIPQPGKSETQYKRNS